jgi:hypothetical protein
MELDISSRRQLRLYISPIVMVLWIIGISGVLLARRPSTSVPDRAAVPVQ